MSQRNGKAREAINWAQDGSPRASLRALEEARSSGNPSHLFHLLHYVASSSGTSVLFCSVARREAYVLHLSEKPFFLQ